jgi:hypothetical protein
MVVFVKLIGVALMGYGVAFMVNPGLLKKYVTFWAKGKMLYTGGVLNIIIGAALLLAAFQCKRVWFVMLISIMSLAKGIAIFSLGKEKWAAKLDWWAARPVKTVRYLAILALAIGVLLIYSA